MPLDEELWLIIALIREIAGLVYDVRMVTLAIDNDWEVTLNPAQVLFIELAPHAHAHAL